MTRPVPVRTRLSFGALVVCSALVAGCTERRETAQPVHLTMPTPGPTSTEPAPKLELTEPPPAPEKPAPAQPVDPAVAEIERLDPALAGRRLAQAESDIESIDDALEHYALNNSGWYPDSLEVLVTPDVNGATYLKATKLPQDPWGRDYVYELQSSGRQMSKLYTLGRDGRAGGTGEDADVDNFSLYAGRPR